MIDKPRGGICALYQKANPQLCADAKSDRNLHFAVSVREQFQLQNGHDDQKGRIRFPGGFG
jgi:hypothetical protein